MAAEDFNPGFAFDVGDVETPSQAPWEFAGALQMALKDRKQPASTIDDKISRRLQEQQRQQQHRQQRQQHKGQAAGREQQSSKKRQRAAQTAVQDSEDSASDSDGEAAAEEESNSDEENSQEAEDDVEDDSELDDEVDSEDGSEDKPLPGELESEDGDEDEESGSEEDEEADGRPQPKHQQKGPSSIAAAAAARKAAADAAGTAAKQAVSNGAAAEPSSTSSQEEAENEQSDDTEGEDLADDSQGDELSEPEEEELMESEQEEEEIEQTAQQRQRPGSTSGRGGAAAVGSTGKGGGKSGGFFAETQRGFKQTGTSFQDLNLSRPLLRAVAALGYASPTPIQAACIPLALSGRDICGSAMTGSGKTGAFALPVLERLLHRPRQVAATYVLILSPTRELAAQIHSMIQKLAQFTDIDAALIVGGLSLPAQAAALRAGPAIVVATPGRIIDHVRNSQGFGLEDLAVLVLDEADRLLEMGFKEELRELLRLAPKQRQTMLFSATFNDDVQQLVQLSLKQPVRLAADPAAMAPKSLSQELVRLKGSAAGLKEAVLLALASRSFSSGRTIVFCKTKQRAHRLKILFGLCKLPPAAELHGDMTQAARLESLERFRQGQVAFLLATDVAARGLDILGVQVVVNFDAPRTLETYLHRIGRTARAGADGVAVTLVSDEDRQLLKEVVKKGKVNLKQRLVPQQAISRWQALVEAAEPDVGRVLAEEREEAALRRAEMEANKAANILQHEDEIYSRPARTWFQTEKEKKALAVAAAAAAEGRTVLEDAAAAGNSAAAKAAANKAAKAVAKQDKRNAKLKEKRAAEAVAGKKPVPALKMETEQFSKNIKGVKSRTRQLIQQGVSAKAAQKMATKAVTGISTKHEKKKRKTAGELFSGDGVSKASAAEAAEGKGRGGAGGGASNGRLKANLDKTQLNKVKRGGKGKSSFKSKKKFKRRK